VIGRTLFRYLEAELLRSAAAALAWLMLVGLLVIFLRTRFTDAGRLLGLRECLAGLIVVVPYLFGFLLPAAILAGAISTFGRLSADNELLAMRAAGLSPVAAAAAPLAAGLLAAAALLWLNVEGYAYAGRALAEVESGFEFSTERLTRPGSSFDAESREGRMIFTFLPEAADGSRRVKVTRWSERGNSFQFLARRYQCEIALRPRGSGKLRRFVDFRLYDVQVIDPDRPHAEGRFEEMVLENLEMPGAISRALIGGGPDMRASLPENLAALRKYRAKLASEVEEYEQGLVAARAGLLASGAGGGAAAAAPAAGAAGRSTLGIGWANDDILAARAEVSRKIAFSLSALFFALVGMGLGSLARRSSKLIGLSLGVLVCALYYGAWVTGRALAEQDLLLPELAPWLPNALCLAAGLWLARRQART